jgi:monodictyphenone polyketide synthase
MYIGAGKKLYQSLPEFASEIQKYNYLCQLHRFPQIISIIDGSATEAVTPVASSLAIVCIAMGLAHIWKLLGVQPSVVIGHSLGEYAALHAAGVLSASDAIYLVGSRAQLALQACEIASHSMLAVRASTDQIRQCLKDVRFEYACRNSKTETVLAGSKVDMAAARECLQGNGYKCHELDVPFAYHSAQMDPILDEFELLAKKVVFKAPNIPVISPLLSGVVFDSKTFTARYVRNATRQTVEFMDALDAAHKISLIDANTVWVDIGAHPLCSGFIRNSLPSTNVVVASMNRKEDNWATLSNSCAVLHSAGFVIDWSQYHRPFEASLRLLDLPKYSWNNKTYWIQYKGTWALTKGNDSGNTGPAPIANSSLQTSSVHRVLHEEIRKPWEAVLLVESDVMQPQFLEAAWGHKMNKCAVVTSVSYPALRCNV